MRVLAFVKCTCSKEAHFVQEWLSRLRSIGGAAMPRRCLPPLMLLLPVVSTTALRLGDF